MTRYGFGAICMVCGAALVVPLLDAVAQSEVTADEIVSRNVAAVGGVEAHRRLTTRRIVRILKYYNEDSPWNITTTRKVPDKLHVRIEMPHGKVTTEGCDGQVAWRQEAGEDVTRLEGHELTIKLQEADFHADTHLLKHSKHITCAGQRDVAEQTYDVLKCALEIMGTNMVETVYVNTTTHLADLTQIPMHDGLSLTTSYGDYREVDGIKLPFSTKMSVTGGGGSEAFAAVTVSNVTHGITVDDTLFAMPKQASTAVSPPPPERAER